MAPTGDGDAAVASLVRRDRGHFLQQKGELVVTRELATESILCEALFGQLAVLNEQVIFNKPGS